MQGVPFERSYISSSPGHQDNFEVECMNMESSKQSDTYPAQHQSKMQTTSHNFYCDQDNDNKTHFDEESVPLQSEFTNQNCLKYYQQMDSIYQEGLLVDLITGDIPSLYNDLVLLKLTMLKITLCKIIIIIIIIIIITNYNNYILFYEIVVPDRLSHFRQ